MDNEIDIEDLIEEEECVFTLTHGGYIKRLPVSEYRAQGRGGKGVRAMATKEEDYVRTVFTASTHDHILFFTSKGRVFVRKGYTIPEAGRNARGTNIVNILPIETGEDGEKIRTMIRGRGYEEDRYLFFVTKNGTVKRISQASLKNLRSNGMRAISLDEGDKLITVLPTDGSEDILIATRNGVAIRFPETDVRVMGRTAVGVRGIRLRDGDSVIGAASSAEGETLLSLTENGFGKRTDVEEYRYQGRGGYGVTSHRLTEKTGKVAAVRLVSPGKDVLIVTDDGTMIRVESEKISCYGRSSQGVRVMRPAPGSRVIDMEKTDREEAEASEIPEEPTENPEEPAEE